MRRGTDRDRQTGQADTGFRSLLHTFIRIRGRNKGTQDAVAFSPVRWAQIHPSLHNPNSFLHDMFHRTNSPKLSPSPSLQLDFDVACGPTYSERFLCGGFSHCDDISLRMEPPPGGKMGLVRPSQDTQPQQSSSRCMPGSPRSTSRAWKHPQVLLASFPTSVFGLTGL